MGNTYGLWTSKVKASFYFFSHHPQELLFYIWKYNVNVIRFSAVNFDIFILERLTKGGNGREGESLPGSTQLAVCHSYTRRGCGVMKEICWKDSGSTWTFQNFIKAILLRWKLILNSVNCWDVRKCAVLKHIILPGRASNVR